MYPCICLACLQQGQFWFINFAVFESWKRFDNVINIPCLVEYFPLFIKLSYNFFDYFGSIYRWTKPITKVQPFGKCPWRRHQMETFFALLALCAGGSSVTGEFRSQRPVTQSFDGFFNLLLNKRLSKPSIHRWFQTPSRSLWRYCNDCCVFFSVLHWIPFIMHKFVSIPLRTCISLQIIMWIHGPSVRFLHQLHDRIPFSCFELPLTVGNFGMDWCKRQFSWSMLRPARGQWYVASIMMTSSNGNIFRVIGPLCGEFTVHRWIPLTKASDAEVWCFL